MSNSVQQASTVNDDQTAARERYERLKNPQTYRPSFGMSEGTRAELEQHGEAVDPFTGEFLKGDGKPRTRRSRGDGVQGVTRESGRADGSVDTAKAAQVGASAASVDKPAGKK